MVFLLQQPEPEAGDRWAPGQAAGVCSLWTETPKYQ